MDSILNNTLIDIGSAAEIEKWSRILNCMKEDLIKAVMDIGPKANIVNYYLELNRKKLE